MKSYFYFSPYPDSYRNLAIDEHLLNSLGPGEAALFLYVNENAVIIGRNQNPWRECDLSRLEADGVQLVRRCSGGGAVYHDKGNLNFSFIAHRDRYDEKAQTALVLSVLEGFGIRARATGRNDLTVDGRKFSGSAYCARGENRQRHGTLLIDGDLSAMQSYLTVSARKLRAKGVFSVRARVCNLSEFCPGLTVAAVADALRSAAGDAEVLRFSAEDLLGIDRLRARNESWAWRMGEAPEFDYSFENRFDWGTAELCLSVKGGLVEDAALFTDALDIGLPDRVRERLMGERFDPAGLAARLSGGGPMGDLGIWLREALTAWERE